MINMGGNGSFVVVLESADRNFVDLDWSEIQDAGFFQVGRTDLKITADEYEVLLKDFMSRPSATVETRDGAVLPRDFIDAFVTGEESQPTAALNDAGVNMVASVESLTGDAWLHDAAGRMTKLEAGQSIPEGSQVLTGDVARMTLLLEDGSTVLIGENARISIDRLKYDADTHSGQMIVSLLKGLFAFASGLIAKDDPDNVVLRTPTSEIGLRGTKVIGDIDAEGVSRIGLLEGKILVETGQGIVSLDDSFSMVEVSAASTMPSAVMEFGEGTFDVDDLFGGVEGLYSFMHLPAVDESGGRGAADYGDMALAVDNDDGGSAREDTAVEQIRETADTAIGDDIDAMLKELTDPQEDGVGDDTVAMERPESYNVSAKLDSLFHDLINTVEKYRADLEIAGKSFADLVETERVSLNADGNYVTALEILHRSYFKAFGGRLDDFLRYASDNPPSHFAVADSIALVLADYRPTAMDGRIRALFDDRDMEDVRIPDFDDMMRLADEYFVRANPSSDADMMEYGMPASGRPAYGDSTALDAAIITVRAWMDNPLTNSISITKSDLDLMKKSADAFTNAVGGRGVPSALDTVSTQEETSKTWNQFLDDVAALFNEALEEAGGPFTNVADFLASNELPHLANRFAVETFKALGLNLVEGAPNGIKFEKDDADVAQRVDLVFESIVVGRANKAAQTAENDAQSQNTLHGELDSSEDSESGFDVVQPRLEGPHIDIDVA